MPEGFDPNPELQHMAPVAQVDADPRLELARAREALFAGSGEVTAEVRDKQLDVSLDDYADLIVEQDRAAYLSDSPDAVHKGLPKYIPDGFVDLGSDDKRRDPTVRSDDREQIWVDKQEILAKYKPVLKELIQRDYSGVSDSEKALAVADRLAQEVFFTMPAFPNAAGAKIGLGNDKIRLSSMEESMCRHKSLVFQVLGQSMGLELQASKGYVDGNRHAENFLKAGDDWYLYDATLPDYIINDKGQKEWRPGRFPVDGPPAEGAVKRYTVQGPFSGRPHKYIARDDSYWYVEHLPS